MRGYKVFYKDNNGIYSSPSRYKKFYFEESKTYEEEEVEVGIKGFHYCETIRQLEQQRPILPAYPIYEIEAEGIIKELDNVFACSKISLVKKLSLEEVYKIYLSELNKAIQESEIVIEYDTIEKEVLQSGIINSRYSRGSYICNSSFVDRGEAIYDSTNIILCNNVEGSNNINNSDYILYSSNVKDSYGVIHGNFIDCCNSINRSFMIADSNNVHFSQYVNFSDMIFTSNHIFGSYCIVHCSHLTNSIFCFGQTNGDLLLFNEKITLERFREVKKGIQYLIENNAIIDIINYKNIEEYRDFNYSMYPTYSINNLSIKEFFEVNKELTKYIKSLKEFNAKIYSLITRGLQ